MIFWIIMNVIYYLVVYAGKNFNIDHISNMDKIIRFTIFIPATFIKLYHQGARK
jgi:hypothetical protein